MNKNFYINPLILICFTLHLLMLPANAQSFYNKKTSTKKTIKSANKEPIVNKAAKRKKKPAANKPAKASNQKSPGKIKKDLKKTSVKTSPRIQSEVSDKILYGVASFYADKFIGRLTANGEIFNQSKYTAACNVLPLGTWIQVTNLSNGKIVVVKTNDRLHHKNKRIIDLTTTAAKKLNFIAKGLTKVKIEVLNQALYNSPSASGSNKQKKKELKRLLKKEKKEKKEEEKKEEESGDY